MDRMSLFDFFTVGVPEIGLIMLLALLWGKGKENIKYTVDFFIKISISIIGIFTVVYFIRIYFFSGVLCCICTNIAATIFLKTLFKLNLRQAFVSSLLSGAVIAFTENMSIPLYNIVYTKISSGSLFFNYRFVLSLPTRITQIILLIITLKYDIRLDKKAVIDKPWSKLAISKKFNFILCLVLFSFWSLLLENYPGIIIKFIINDLDYSHIQTNIYFLFLCVSIFSTLVLLHFNRTIKYEKLKRYIHKSPDEVVASILENSSYEELHKYTKTFLKELHIVKIEKLYDYLDSLKHKYKYFDYKVDENIVLCDCDYTTVMHLGEYFLELLSQIKINNDRLFKAAKKDKIISCTLFIYKSNDIQYKKLLKVLSNDKEYLKYKKDIEKALNTLPYICFKRGTIILNADISLKKSIETSN